MPAMHFLFIRLIICIGMNGILSVCSAGCLILYAAVILKLLDIKYVTVFILDSFVRFIIKQRVSCYMYKYLCRASEGHFVNIHVASDSCSCCGTKPWNNVHNSRRETHLKWQYREHVNAGKKQYFNVSEINKNSNWPHKNMWHHITSYIISYVSIF